VGCHVSLSQAGVAYMTKADTEEQDRTFVMEYSSGRYRVV